MERYECPDCKGTGCEKCNNKGSLDWIENIVGAKKHSLKVSFKLSDEDFIKFNHENLRYEVIKKLSNEITESLDRQIMESIMKEI